MKKINYILIALLFSACQTELEMPQEEVSPLVATRSSSLQFAQTDNLNLNDLGISNPTKIIRKDSLYVILTPKSKYRFAIYNERSGDLQHLVRAGKGEGEGLYYLNLSLNGNIVSSLDFGTGRFVEIDLSKYTNSGYMPTFTALTTGGKTPLNAIRAGNQLISTGVYTEGRYCVSNLADDTDAFSVTYPECSDELLSDTIKSIFYASNCLAVNPSQNRLACANMQYGCLDICDINGNQLTRINELHLNHASVSFQHKRSRGRGMWHPVAYTRNNLFGFCDVTSSDDYIFALYSGRTYRKHKNNIDKGQTILVFDWNGSHVRSYQLSSSCSSISYDKASNTIYALSHKKGKAEIIKLNL